jgi:hypothetical protein
MATSRGGVGAGMATSSNDDGARWQLVVAKDKI